jgi:hypothetical protein
MNKKLLFLKFLSILLILTSIINLKATETASNEGKKLGQMLLAGPGDEAFYLFLKQIESAINDPKVDINSVVSKKGTALETLITSDKYTAEQQLELLKLLLASPKIKVTVVELAAFALATYSWNHELAAFGNREGKKKALKLLLAKNPRLTEGFLQVAERRPEFLKIFKEATAELTKEHSQGDSKKAEPAKES